MFDYQNWCLVFDSVALHTRRFRGFLVPFLLLVLDFLEDNDLRGGLGNLLPFPPLLILTALNFAWLFFRFMAGCESLSLSLALVSGEMRLQNNERD